MSANQSIDSHDEITELWFNLVESKYPNMPIAKIYELRITGATEWCFGHENEAATLFEQFIMMKTLKELKYEDEK